MKRRQKADFQTVAGGREITFKEALGQVVFVGILYAIAYSCFFVAILNLLFVRPLPVISALASLAWITIIVASIVTSVVSGCHRTGIRQYLIDILAHIIRNRFAEFTSDDSGESILGFGYRIGTRRHYLLKLRSKGITAIDWGPGQGNISWMDNDWYVAMWFDVDSMILDGIHIGGGIFIVGPSGRKAGREAFGDGFIEFLKANHVQLTVPPRELLGQVAEVVEPLRPYGRIRIGLDEYAAQRVEGMFEDIERGRQVVIEEIIGTRICVRQINGPNQAVEATS